MLKHNGDRVGPLATIRCKPRQVRKEATVAADSCAGMWLVRLPPNIVTTLRACNELPGTRQKMAPS